jgi:RHS repeat-associated protein
MGNGVGIASAFNNRQSISSLVYSNSGGPIWSKQLSWDNNASNLTLLADGITGKSRQFTYDPLNRITSANDVGGGLTETYSYDPFGNITQSGNFSFSQSYNTLNQIAGYSYDANGDQNTDIWSHALAFDANGMLSSVAGGQETYVYDPQGNRVEVHGATVTDYIYFGGVPIAIRSSAGTYTDLIYAGGSLIAEVAGTQGADPMYRVTDSLNSLGGNPSISGLTGGMDYAPYGQVVSGSTSDPFGYTGLQWDPTTSTNHATFRQFSIQQGRWQSPDPYSGSYNWADPQSLNRYSYVNGQAMAFTDPSGMFFCGTACAAPVSAGCPLCAGIIIGVDIVGGIYDLGKMFGWWGSRFHGSLKPRPGSGPTLSDASGDTVWNGQSMGESLGMPIGWTPASGDLASMAQGALGLPTMADVGCNPICDATSPGNSAVPFAMGQNSQTCLSTFYGSAAGKAIDKLSWGGLIWSPNRVSNWQDLFFLSGGKAALIGGMSKGDSIGSLFRTTDISAPLNGFANGLGHGLVKWAGRVVNVATGIDAFMNIGCRSPAMNIDSRAAVSF